MTVRRETTTARRRLEFMLRACVRLLAKPGTSDKEIRSAIEHLLTRVGPADKQPDVLAELVRRGEYVPADGYPGQSMADSDIHGGFAQTGSTSTERAALRWGSEPEDDAVAHGRAVQPDDPDRQLERDVAGDALRELVTNIDAAATYLGDADTTRRFLLSIQWRQKDEPPVDTCSLCGAVVTKVGDDRLRSLYCPACHKAWTRAGAPREVTARGQFERARLAKLAERAEGHVTCAHVCCPSDMRCSPTHEHFHAPETCPSCAEVRAEAS